MGVPTPNQRNANSETENTPLLSSSSSRTENGDESEVLEGGSGRRRKGDGDSNQSVTGLRACFIIASLGVLIFLQATNMSMMTTTQSDIASDLNAFSSTSWFTSAYLIAGSSVAPLAGRLTNIFSPRSCTLVSSIIFAIGSFVTSRATSLPLFLVGRAITGIGAAGVLTLSIILVIELTSKKRRGLMIGLMNTGYTSGVALGAVIAGALVSGTGWRFLFWIQTPMSLLAGLCIYFSIPHTFTAGKQALNNQSASQKLARIDYLGAITLISLLVSLLYSLAHPKIPILPIIASFLLFLTFLCNELYLANEPIIPVTILKNRGALLSCLAQLGLMMARWTVLFYTPVYAIAIKGWAPAAAGSMLIPTNAGFAIGGILAGLLHIRRGGSFYAPTVIAFALFPLTLLTLSILSNPETHPLPYIATTFTNGLITGAALNYTLAHLLHLTTPSTHFIATSLLATFRGFAGSFSSATAGGIFTRILSSSLSTGFADKQLDSPEIQELIRKLLGSPATVNLLDGVEREVAVRAYTTALKGVFLAGAILSVGVIAIQAGTGWTAPVDEEEVGEQEESGDEAAVDAREEIGAA